MTSRPRGADHRRQAHRRRRREGASPKPAWTSRSPTTPPAPKPKPAADDIRAAGRRAHIAQRNLGNPDDCRALVEGAAAAFGRLDVLVNMASVYKSVPFDETRRARWNAAIDIDLRAAFLCARAAVPHMRRGGGGRIINFSDWVAASGRPRYPGFLPYYVAKAGAIALTEALALELAGDQILVNAVAPGPISRRPARPTKNSRPSKPPRPSAAGAAPTPSSAP